VIGFAEPAAWWGAIAIAMPIAVHFVRRHRARRQPFPTLQFLHGSRVAAVRLDRLTDLGLLAVRIAVISGAVAALAQPVWRSGSASAASSSALVRAVVVDAALGSDDAAVLGDRSRLSPAASQVDIEATSLAAGLDEAAGWIARQAGTREIVVMSPFPIGSLSRDALDVVPPGIGLRFIAVDRRRDDPAPSKAPSIDWRAPAADRPGMDRALAAAASLGLRSPSSGRPVTVAFPGAPDADTLASRAKPIAHAWMYDAIRSLSANASLGSSVHGMTPAGVLPPAVSTPLLLNETGDVVLAAAEADARLLVLCRSPADSFFTSVLAVALANATGDVPLGESMRIGPAVLTSWERAASAAPPVTRAPDGRPLGRWVWLIVLLLLTLEGWWRARERSVADPVEARRVA
jgi:Aerotolerance regulator N-terminal